MLSLSILVENTARGPGILGEHGLSYHIDTGKERVLFDTGQGFTLSHNAARLGIELPNIDAIVLSHGHYDHTGGLETALEMAPNAALFLHPAASNAKYIGRKGGKPRKISTPFMESESFRTLQRRVVAQRDPCEVVPGIWMSGEIPRVNLFEDTGGPFYLDEELLRPDPLLDDQSLFLKTPAGLFVILGCAHSGVVNTLQHIQMLTNETRVHTIIGGLHLESASPDRMEKTIAALKTFAPERLGFCHCTGFAATARLWGEFPGKCFQVHAGLKIGFAE